MVGVVLLFSVHIKQQLLSRTYKFVFRNYYIPGTFRLIETLRACGILNVLIYLSVEKLKKWQKVVKVCSLHHLAVFLMEDFGTSFVTIN